MYNVQKSNAIEWINPEKLENHIYIQKLLWWFYYANRQINAKLVVLFYELLGIKHTFSQKSMIRMIKYTHEFLNLHINI